MSYNANLADFGELGRLISRRVMELKLVNCDMNTKNLKCLSENVFDSKVMGDQFADYIVLNIFFL